MIERASRSTTDLADPGAPASTSIPRGNADDSSENEEAAMPVHWLSSKFDVVTCDADAFPRSSVGLLAYMDGTQEGYYDQRLATMWFGDQAKHVERVVWTGLLLPRGASERFRDPVHLFNKAEMNAQSVVLDEVGGPARKGAKAGRKDGAKGAGKEAAGERRTKTIAALMNRQRVAVWGHLTCARGLDTEEVIAAAKRIAERQFVRHGMAVRIAIHADASNVHVHFLATARQVVGERFTGYAKPLGTAGDLSEWQRQNREMAALAQNALLSAKGSEERVEWRRFEHVGVPLIPHVHEGAAAVAASERGDTKPLSGGEDRRFTNRRVAAENRSVVAADPWSIVATMDAVMPRFGEDDLRAAIRQYGGDDLVPETLAAILKDPRLVAVEDNRLDASGERQGARLTTAERLANEARARDLAAALARAGDGPLDGGRRAAVLSLPAGAERNRTLAAAVERLAAEGHTVRLMSVIGAPGVEDVGLADGQSTEAGVARLTGLSLGRWRWLIEERWNKPADQPEGADAQTNGTAKPRRRGAFRRAANDPVVLAQVAASAADAALRAGDVVVLADAELADPNDLSWLLQTATEKGASVLLVAAAERTLPHERGALIRTLAAACGTEIDRGDPGDQNAPEQGRPAPTESRTPDLKEEISDEPGRDPHRVPVGGSRDQQRAVQRSAGGTRAGGARKPDVARVGTQPPPAARGRLRRLSQLDVVRFERGNPVLLPGHVPGVVEHQGAERDHALRRRDDRPGSRLTNGTFASIEAAAAALADSVSSGFITIDDGTSTPRPVIAADADTAAVANAALRAAHRRGVAGDEHLALAEGGVRAVALKDLIVLTRDVVNGVLDVGAEARRAAAAAAMREARKGVRGRKPATVEPVVPVAFRGEIGRVVAVSAKPSTMLGMADRKDIIVTLAMPSAEGERRLRLPLAEHLDWDHGWAVPAALATASAARASAILRSGDPARDALLDRVLSRSDGLATRVPVLSGPGAERGVGKGVRSIVSTDRTEGGRDAGETTPGEGSVHAYIAARDAVVAFLSDGGDALSPAGRGLIRARVDTARAVDLKDRETREMCRRFGVRRSHLEVHAGRARPYLGKAEREAIDRLVGYAKVADKARTLWGEIVQECVASGTAWNPRVGEHDALIAERDRLAATIERSRTLHGTALRLMLESGLVEESRGDEEKGRRIRPRRAKSANAATKAEEGAEQAAQEREALHAERLRARRALEESVRSAAASIDFGTLARHASAHRARADKEPAIATLKTRFGAGFDAVMEWAAMERIASAKEATALLPEIEANAADLRLRFPDAVQAMTGAGLVDGRRFEEMARREALRSDIALVRQHLEDGSRSRVAAKAPQEVLDAAERLAGAKGKVRGVEALLAPEAIDWTRVETLLEGADAVRKRAPGSALVDEVRKAAAVVGRGAPTEDEIAAVRAPAAILMKRMTRGGEQAGKVSAKVDEAGLRDVVVWFGSGLATLVHAAAEKQMCEAMDEEMLPEANARYSDALADVRAVLAADTRIAGVAREVMTKVVSGMQRTTDGSGAVTDLDPRIGATIGAADLAPVTADLGLPVAIETPVR